VLSISRTFAFESAHYLPNVPDGHKCGRLHGHSYEVTVHITGPVGATTGWIMDFGDVAALVDPVVRSLDHRTLNDIPGLANPTSENLAVWFWTKLADGLPGLSTIEVSETRKSKCILTRPPPAVGSAVNGA
jgi:6-pyruvoyltetrahydropterin/6-carboxytetrahydropterin synthase